MTRPMGRVKRKPEHRLRRTRLQPDHATTAGFGHMVSPMVYRRILDGLRHVDFDADSIKATLLDRAPRRKGAGWCELDLQRDDDARLRRY